MNKLIRIVNGPYGTNCYICVEKEGVSLIDAPFPPSMLISEIKKYGPLLNIYLTHAHFDHTLAVPTLLQEWKEAKVYMAKEDFIYFQNNGEKMKEQLATFDPFFLSRYGENISALPQDINFIEDGDMLGQLRVIKTPGHTYGSVCYYNQDLNVLFSGDTLFYNSVGRTDLGGNSEMLLASLKKLMMLPFSTVVLPGHGEQTTIREENNSNAYII